jgi:AraC-like DNA-binding protein
MLFEQTEARDGSDLAMWGLFLELASELARAGAKTKRDQEPPEFRSTVSWIENHFCEDVHVADLARRAGLSYRGYTARFAATMGTSPHAYVAQRRIKHACQLLAQGSPIIDTALACGFQDLSNFYRQFKRLCGCTPAEWGKKR